MICGASPSEALLSANYLHLRCDSDLTSRSLVADSLQDGSDGHNVPTRSAYTFQTLLLHRFAERRILPRGPGALRQRWLSLLKCLSFEWTLSNRACNRSSAPPLARALLEPVLER